MDFEQEVNSLIAELKKKYAPGHVLFVLDAAKKKVQTEIGYRVLQNLEKESLPINVVPEFLSNLVETTERLNQGIQLEHKMNRSNKKILTLDMLKYPNR